MKYFLIILSLIFSSFVFAKTSPKNTDSITTETHYEYVDSDICYYGNKRYVKQTEKELENKHIDLDTGQWLYSPYTCLKISDLPQDIFLLAFRNKNTPVSFYIILKNNQVASVKVNEKKYLNGDFKSFNIDFSKNVDESTKRKILFYLEDSSKKLVERTKEADEKNKKVKL